MRNICIAMLLHLYSFKAPNILEHEALESFLERRKEKKRKEKEERKQRKIDNFFKKIKKEKNDSAQNNDTSIYNPWIVTPKASKGLNILDKSLLKPSKSFTESSLDLNADINEIVNTVNSASHLSVGDMHLPTLVFTVVNAVTDGNITADKNEAMPSNSNCNRSDMVLTSLKVKNNMNISFPDTSDKLCGPSDLDAITDCATDKNDMDFPDMANQICCICDIKRQSNVDNNICVRCQKNSIHQEEKYCQTVTSSTSVVEVQTERVEICTQSLQTDVLETMNLEVQTELIPTKSQCIQTCKAETCTLECQTNLQAKAHKYFPKKLLYLLDLKEQNLNVCLLLINRLFCLKLFKTHSSHCRYFSLIRSVIQ